MLARSWPHLDRGSPVAESYRMLRANLQLSNPDESPKVLLITSAFPGEGKTLTTANLGMSLAKMGEKVLVVDGDLKRPRLHPLFLQSREPGLVDYLTSHELEAEVPPWLVRSTEHDNLWIVTCGRRAPNSAELLGSQRMRLLLKGWRETYDLVLIDSAPIISVADSLILAREVDGLIMVVRAHQTKERAVEQVRDRLTQTGVSLLGVVLNDVDYSKQYGAYYYYYHYSYRYYDARDDE